MECRQLGGRDASRSAIKPANIEVAHVQVMDDADRLWHERLGHVNAAMVRRLRATSALNGMDEK